MKKVNLFISVDDIQKAEAIADKNSQSLSAIIREGLKLRIGLDKRIDDAKYSVINDLNARKLKKE